LTVAATDSVTLPFTEPVFIFNDDNAVLISAIVPITTKRVLLPVKVNPLAAIRPLFVSKTNVVPAGGFTKLIDVSKVDVAENPLNTNPLAVCPEVDCKKDLESGADTLCPNPKNDVNKNNVTNRYFIIQLLS
jgi:hypothetical protein